MRYLALGEVLALHRRILAASGGRTGVRDLGAIASALAQPRVTVGEKDAYPTLIEKAAALGYSLIRSHGSIDGNKRISHAAMGVFLVLNGVEIQAHVDEQERFMLSLAAGESSREQLVAWLNVHVAPLQKSGRA